MDWDNVPVVGPDAAPDDLITQSADELEEAIQSRPGLRAEIGSVIDRRLSNVTGPESWEQIRRSLVDLLGANSAGLLMWMCVNDALEEDRALRIGRLQQNAKSDVIELIRSIRAAYSHEIQNAWEIFGETPNNWRSIEREIYVDVVRGRPYLKLQLKKFNGEQIVLEGPGDSFLNLAGYLSGALATFEADAGFTTELIDYYLDNTKALSTLLRPPASRKRRTSVSGAG
jgi:hypothetical protein